MDALAKKMEALTEEVLVKKTEVMATVMQSRQVSAPTSRPPLACISTLCELLAGVLVPRWIARSEKSTFWGHGSSVSSRHLEDDTRFQRQ